MRAGDARLPGLAQRVEDKDGAEAKRSSVHELHHLGAQRPRGAQSTNSIIWARSQRTLTEQWREKMIWRGSGAKRI